MFNFRIFFFQKTLFFPKKFFLLSSTIFVVVPFSSPHSRCRLGLIPHPLLSERRHSNIVLICWYFHLMYVFSFQDRCFKWAPFCHSIYVTVYITSHSVVECYMYIYSHFFLIFFLPERNWCFLRFSHPSKSHHTPSTPFYPRPSFHTHI